MNYHNFTPLKNELSRILILELNEFTIVAGPGVDYGNSCESHLNSYSGTDPALLTGLSAACCVRRVEQQIINGKSEGNNIGINFAAGCLCRGRIAFHAWQECVISASESAFAAEPWKKGRVCPCVGDKKTVRRGTMKEQFIERNKRTTIISGENLFTSSL